tara:strand:+ start:436 stop:660 length:225 start_codon:yes stop_codon:yes gene_type:complete
MWPNSNASKRATIGPKMNLKDLLYEGSKLYSRKHNIKTKIRGKKKNTIDGVKDLFFSRAIPHQDPQRKIYINRE